MYRHKKTAVAREAANPSTGGLRRPGQLRSKLTLVLPLIASLASCSSSSDKECVSYNETTMSLNRVTDGRTAGLGRLRRCEGLCEDLVDFINETHRLSSEGMPNSVHVTNPPRSCFYRSWGELPAYAVQKSRSASGRGIYLAPDAGMSGFSKLMRILAHEIGHLQHGNPVRGAEITSQLNSYEQFLMGFVLFYRQGADRAEMKEWFGYMEQDGLADKAMDGRDILVRGTDPHVERYAKSNLFIFLKLAEHEGDFGAVRSETAALMESGGLEAALDGYAQRFLSAYSGISSGDLSKEVRGIYLKTLSARFGESVAAAFHDAASP